MAKKRRGFAWIVNKEGQEFLCPLDSTDGTPQSTNFHSCINATVIDRKMDSQ